MAVNIKQDRNGVRSAQDLERKYDLLGMRKEVSKAQEGAKKTNAELEEFIKETTEGFADLQKELDGKIETWFYNGEPSLTKEPTTLWPKEKYNNHVGDLYYDKDTGKSYRFSKEGDAYQWIYIEDRDLSEALALASAAKDTADKKRQIFVTEPTPPYDKGDLWFKEKEIYICQTPKSGGMFKEEDFVIATDYSERIEDVKKELSVINADVGHISTLLFGSATGTTLHTEFANAVVALISDATIGSAKIISLVADKITSGQLNTNRVNIQSESGRLRITGDTIIIKDSTQTRVQIGKDANEDYNIYILDAAGNIMFDATGVHKDAIKSPIIVDDMVSDNANISAGKLDIDSLFTEINGSQKTIKATKIVFDDTGQTLDVTFNKMVTDVDDITLVIQSQGTAIKAIQGQIEAKIWQQDINQATSSMETKYNTLSSDVDSLKIEIGETTLKTLVNIKFEYAKNDSATVAPTTGWSKDFPTWENGKYIWQKSSMTKGDGEETVIGVACITGAKGAVGTPGKPGEKGEQGVGIKSKKEQYYLSTSDKELAGGQWEDTMPAWEIDKYLWIREQITWTDETVTNTPGVLASAINSANELSKEASDKAQENASAFDSAVKDLKTTIDVERGRINATVSDVESLKGDVKSQKTSMTQTAEEIEIIKKATDGINTFFTFGDSLTIGKSDSEIKSVQDNDSYEFVNKSGDKILELNTKGVNAPAVNVSKQIRIGEKWAIRPGKNNNLNDVWIGG